MKMGVLDLYRKCYFEGVPCTTEAGGLKKKKKRKDEVSLFGRVSLERNGVWIVVMVLSTQQWQILTIKITFIQSVCDSREKNKRPLKKSAFTNFFNDFGVFASEVSHILQATPSKIGRAVGR